jgi:aminoacyl tRNA synthase complex-interacting multifunctional protein 1
MAKMATSDAVLKRLEQKGAEADQIIEYLKHQVALLKEKAGEKILNSLKRY